ncbi:histidine phosphatase superfamily [Scenedesmus sp. NREL 46B-D3]|nr:histidine phosphatase superfamily [Scenedesmus sp. NREL 46B-D3]
MQQETRTLGMCVHLVHVWLVSSRRQDEEDAFWHQTAPRPWDPPLSVKGRVQANEVASQLEGFTVDYVISSPFRRCLQTSAGVVRQLGLKQGQWLVDGQLSEVCDPRVLFSGRHELREQAGKRPVDSWMWKGLSLGAALDKFVNEDCKLSKLPLRPVARPSQLPHYPETLEQGLQRYSSALQEIGRSFAGKTVLVVTHGECVRVAVLLGEPHSEVFEVKHTGFVVLQQHVTAADAATVAAPGAKGSSQHKRLGWKLVSEPGEAGVFWLDDEEED